MPAGEAEFHRYSLSANIKGGVRWFRQRSVTSGSLDLFDLRIWLTRPRADCSGNEMSCIGRCAAQLCTAGRTSIMHAGFAWMWTAPLGELCDLVQPCATKASYTMHDLDCHNYRLIRYIYIRGHSRMCICGCIFICIYDYTFELGIRVFLHALIRIYVHAVDSFWWRPPVPLYRVQLWQLPCLAANHIWLGLTWSHVWGKRICVTRARALN